MTLKPGDEAPDFELRSHRGGTVKLSSFRGKKNVVLAFHPLAFTPVCANQMSGYQSELSRFDAHARTDEIPNGQQARASSSRVGADRHY